MATYILFIIGYVSALQPITKIAFGSCAGIYEQQNPEIFKTIDAFEPDAFIWLGDVVYADEMVGPLIFHPTEPEVWRKKFTDFKEKDGYLQLRKNRRILGVWDDHDYGQNGGDKHHPHKELARQIFLDFMDEAPESQRWTRPGGIYEAYTIKAPEGIGRTIKVILLGT